MLYIYRLKTVAAKLINIKINDWNDINYLIYLEKKLIFDYGMWFHKNSHKTSLVEYFYYKKTTVVI